MASTLLLCLLSVGVGVVVVAGQDYCSPTCDDDSSIGDTFPEPSDCTKYWMCMPDLELQWFQCGSDNQYDVDTHKCQEDAKCGICQPACQFTCPIDSDVTSFRANLTDCSIYYMCMPGGDEIMTNCSANGNGNDFFDGNQCTKNESKCCSATSCFPYCWENQTSIADPANCAGFYYCPTEGGKPLGPALCYEGNFNAETGECDPDAPCNQPCAGLTTPPGSLTTTTTTTTSLGNCHYSWTCTEAGYFPACTNRCSQRYFYCASTSGQAATHLCPGDQLMDPDQTLCVEPEECPYPPDYTAYSNVFSTVC